MLIFFTNLCHASGGGDSDFLDQLAKIGDGASIAITAPLIGSNPKLKVPAKAQAPGFNPANEIKINNAFKTTYKILDKTGRMLGFVSYIGHCNNGWQSFNNGDIIGGLSNYGLAIVDLAIILYPATRPSQYAAVFLYDVIDLSTNK